ncbi:MAG: hypothetical protein R3D89_01205 [Sphingomonadaceae bacterium]|jgi:hypothetical protein
MGKVIAFFLLFGMFIFLFAKAEDDGASSQPRTIVIKRDRQLETGIDRSRIISNESQPNDWGPDS